MNPWPELDSEHGAAVLLMLNAHNFDLERIAHLFNTREEDVMAALIDYRARRETAGEAEKPANHIPGDFDF